MRGYLTIHKLAEAIRKSANPRANQIAADRTIRYAKIVFTMYLPYVGAKIIERLPGFCPQSPLTNESSSVSFHKLLPGQDTEFIPEDVVGS